jgi:putative transposase
MIHDWKKQLLQHSSQVFEGNAKKSESPGLSQPEVDKLYRKIGQLQVERDFLASRPGLLELIKRVIFSSGPQRKSLIDLADKTLSVKRQCALLGLSRSTCYYREKPKKEDALNLMKSIDQLYTKHPFMGSRQITQALKKEGLHLNRKKVQRLMRRMGIQAVAPGPHTSTPHPMHPKYPYLLRNLSIVRPNQVWCSDITYIPMKKGFLYLTVIMDWYSRKVLSWRVSNTLDADFCVEALKEAFQRFGVPEIFNTDQGAQFTSDLFLDELKERHIKISMDGKGRALDNVFVERLWRTVKYEHIYLKPAESGLELKRGLSEYFDWYNQNRSHSSIDFHTPDAVYFNFTRIAA